MARKFLQFRLLLWKNFILQIRRPIGTLIEILLPAIFASVLILARSQISSTDKCFTTPTAEHFGAFLSSNININASANISKILYYPINNSTTLIANNVAQKLGLGISTTNRQGISITSLQMAAEEASEFYTDDYYGLLVFENVVSGPLPKNIRYTIRLSHDIIKEVTGSDGPRSTWRTKRTYPNFPQSGPRTENLYMFKSRFVPLQYATDLVITELQSGQSDPLFPRRLQRLPYPEYKKDDFINTIEGLMPLLFTLAFIYTAVMIVKELVAEKESRLKESMKMMGLENWIHWLAWFLKQFIFLFISVAVLTLLLKVGNIFKYAETSLLFVMFLLYAIAMISFCFAVSAFFTNAIRGMLFGAVLWFGTLVPYLAFSNASTYEGLSRGAKAASCLLPNTCLGIAAKVLAKYESSTVGASWSNITKTPIVDENFSLGAVFLMLIVQSVMYLIITWYVEGVLPGEYGIAKPFYFPFLPSYWCGSSHANSVSSVENLRDSMRIEPNEDVEEEPIDTPIGVGIHKLRKVYKSATGKKVAVNDLSLNMFKGQITALLGHNGAGKTTTMSILTGLFSPTKGSAFINGRSILTEMDTIRDSLGLCPQHNVLFDRLTVEEHLEFFAALKGKSGKSAKADIKQMLEDIQLTDKRKSQSKTLSGGMKRKLSCAIALIGEPEIIFLDEPTSGMDPYARRATWDLLQKYRAGRTIILTTHFMDEADYLGDRIAIMADGQLRCCGSSLFLKKRYGVGYHMTIVKGEKFQQNNVIGLLQSSVPNSKMAGNIGAELSYVLDYDDAKNFKELFATLESNQEQLGISSFGVSITTLEEVFLKVGEGFDQALTAQANGHNDAELLEQHKIDLYESNVKKLKLMNGSALMWSRYTALLKKRFIDFKRNFKSLLKQVVLPLVLVLGGLLLERITPGQEDDPLLVMKLSHLAVGDIGSTVGFYADYRNETVANKAQMFESAKSFYSTVSVVPEDITTKSLNIKNGNINNTVLVRGETTMLTLTRTECCLYPYFIMNNNCLSSLVSEFSICGSSSTFGYRHKDCESCTNSAGSSTGTNCSLSFQNTDTTDNHLYFSEEILERSDSKDFFEKHTVGFTLDDDSQNINGKPLLTSWYSNEAYHTIPEGLSAINNILLQYTMNDTGYSITTSNHPLPRSTKEQSDLADSNFASLTLMIFVTMGVCFIAASFVPFIVQERVSKAKHIQFVSGVDALHYWGSNYTWDLVNYMIPAICIVILFAAFQSINYRGEDLGVLFLCLIFFGMSMLPLVYVLSFIFSSPLIAYAALAFLMMILSLFMVIAIFILGMPVFDLEDIADILHHIFLLLPTYALPQSFLDLGSNAENRRICTISAATRFGCEQRGIVWHTSALNWEKPGIGKHLVYMLVEAIVFFIFTILIENNFYLNSTSKSTLADTNLNRRGEDVDVSAERKKVELMNPNEVSNNAIVIKNLSKVYRSTHMVAVDNLSIAIPKGECFGLLGVNGAGKTTTFGMLTGELGITAGTAHLDGLDIQKHLREVQQNIGYCPQFDALVGRLTGREMLELFARLRGVEQESINDIVNSAIEMLNLTKHKDKMCGDYSGGNKRKLSTALALVGDPPTIFLDEPTSGMDPGARRFLWNTLTGVLHSGRSIILTTHSMEECEALCTRIVIMVNGQFKCVGSIQHLKSRFGQGYSMMVKIGNGSRAPTPRMERAAQNNGYQHHETEDGKLAVAFSVKKGSTNVSSHLMTPTVSSESLAANTADIKQFLAASFPGAEIVEERKGMLQYKINNPELRWSYMFGTLEENAERLGIVDYSVSQTSLEQVFIDFAKEQLSEDRATVSGLCGCCG